LPPDTIATVVPATGPKRPPRRLATATAPAPAATGGSNEGTPTASPEVMVMKV
jgi:hypothetical protein